MTSLQISRMVRKQTNKRLSKPRQIVLEGIYWKGDKSIDDFVSMNIDTFLLLDGKKLPCRHGDAVEIIIRKKQEDIQHRKIGGQAKCICGAVMKKGRGRWGNGWICPKKEKVKKG